LNASDIAFLCLPDPAAMEAVAMVDNPNTAVIDTSTAHRTNPEWTYGFPELCGKREAIQKSKRIANPGCHASGFVALVEPLVRFGVLPKTAKLSVYSLTGYSGGGKKMIAEYEDANRSPLLEAPRLYGISQEHKHLKEMVAVCGLDTKPVFSPIVAPYYSGMELAISLFPEQIQGSFDDVVRVYQNYYSKGLVRFAMNCDEGGFMSAAAFSGRDDMQISVTGNEDRILLVSRFDNLGKGASGAAIQNMNIILGVDEATGLTV